MTNHRIKMRLSGTESDLKAYLYLLRAMDRKGLIEILEESQPYPNRGDSKFFRAYLEIDLNIPEGVDINQRP
jgi:hypothetical protein